MTTKIPVTWADLRQGVWRNTRFCPVALALKRHFGIAPEIVVPNYFTITVGQRYLSIRLPEEVAERIIAFDNGVFVTPFVIHLTPYA